MYKILAKTLFVGKKLIYLPSCHSTNDVASELLKKEGVNDGAIVITDNQTQGKGQRGNKWDSEEGKNLTFSLIIHPTFLTASQQFNLNIITSLGIYNFLKSIHPSFKVKWPNDIYFKGKKLGGILIQNSLKNNRIEACVIGIGLNVNQTQFNLTSAISLKNITAQDHKLDTVLEEVCHGIEIEYLKLKSGKIELLKSQYLDNLLGYQEERLFRADREFRGVISGVSSEGRLQIQTVNDMREFDFKQVEFL